MNTSDLSRPRIARTNLPRKKIYRTNYRKVALSSVILDFERRCAYSMIHALDAGGYTEMEIDHFDPRRKSDRIQSYDNLYYSSGHCNRFKGNAWPTEGERKNGIRFIDCCIENDYGKVLFEDPETHKIVGTTSAAKYHIINLDLNAEHFIERRRQRSEIIKRLNCPVALRATSGSIDASQVLGLIEMLKSLLELAIPQIPPLPLT